MEIFSKEANWYDESNKFGHKFRWNKHDAQKPFLGKVVAPNGLVCYANGGMYGYI